LLFFAINTPAYKEFPYTPKGYGASARMITSKITSKAQTTIPQAVREALRVREGDELAYKIERGRVILTKAVHTADDPFATFAEWGSENDRRAYGDL
jgi:antitoxin PrlF